MKRLFKLILFMFTVWFITSLYQTKTYAITDDTQKFNYELTSEGISGSNYDIKGFGYVRDGLGYTQLGLTHKYVLELENQFTGEKFTVNSLNDYRIGDAITDIEYADGGVNYDYTDVSFHFSIPLSKLIKNDKNVWNVKIRLYRGNSYKAYNIKSSNLSTTALTYNNNRYVFKTNGETTSSYIYSLPTDQYVYARSSAGKDRTSDTTYYSNCIPAPSNYYYLTYNSTPVLYGKVFESKVVDKVTWFKFVGYLNKTITHERYEVSNTVSENDTYIWVASPYCNYEQNSAPYKISFTKANVPTQANLIFTEDDTITSSKIINHISLNTSSDIVYSRQTTPTAIICGGSYGGYDATLPKTNPISGLFSATVKYKQSVKNGMEQNTLSTTTVYIKVPIIVKPKEIQYETPLYKTVVGTDVETLKTKLRANAIPISTMSNTGYKHTLKSYYNSSRMLCYDSTATTINMLNNIVFDEIKNSKGEVVTFEEAVETPDNYTYYSHIDYTSQSAVSNSANGVVSIKNNAVKTTSETGRLIVYDDVRLTDDTRSCKQGSKFLDYDSELSAIDFYSIYAKRYYNSRLVNNGGCDFNVAGDYTVTLKADSKIADYKEESYTYSVLPVYADIVLKRGKAWIGDKFTYEETKDTIIDNVQTFTDGNKEFEFVSEIDNVVIEKVEYPDGVVVTDLKTNHLEDTINSIHGLGEIKVYMSVVNYFGNQSNFIGYIDVIDDSEPIINSINSYAPLDKEITREWLVNDKKVKVRDDSRNPVDYSNVQIVYVKNLTTDEKVFEGTVDNYLPESEYVKTFDSFVECTFEIIFAVRSGNGIVNESEPINLFLIDTSSKQYIRHLMTEYSYESEDTIDTIPKGSIFKYYEGWHEDLIQCCKDGDAGKPIITIYLTKEDRDNISNIGEKAYEHRVFWSRSYQSITEYLTARNVVVFHADNGERILINEDSLRTNPILVDYIDKGFRKPRPDLIGEPQPFILSEYRILEYLSKDWRDYIIYDIDTLNEKYPTPATLPDDENIFITVAKEQEEKRKKLKKLFDFLLQE